MNFLVRKMIYPGSFVSVPSSPPEPLQKLELPVSEEVKIMAWYYERDPVLPFLIYFHGNAENLQTVWLSGMIGQLQALRVNFIIIDYPGYGRSGGEAHESMLLQSAAETVNWVKKNYPASQIILCGWSLGAAVAILTANKFPEKVDGLIALSAWISLEAVAKRHYPDWLVKRFLKENYASIDAASQVNQPVLLIHGSRDSIIPVSHSFELSPKFPSVWKHLVVEEASHNDLLAYPEVWRTITTFLDSIIK